MICCMEIRGTDRKLKDGPCEKCKVTSKQRFWMMVKRILGVQQ